MKSKKLNANLLKETVEHFNVSLSSAVVRYAEIKTNTAVIVMSMLVMVSIAVYFYSIFDAIVVKRKVFQLSLLNGETR